MTTLDLGTPYLQGSLENRVLQVRIDRTDRRNAMTLDMYRGLRDAAIIADENAEIDALCFQGTGDWFCVGADMSLQQIPLTAPQARAMLRADLNHRLSRHDHNMFKHSIMSRR